MSQNKNYPSGGIGFSGLLTIAFIILKLCGVISWSWWWVVSPSLISLALIIAALLGLGLIALFLVRKP